MRTNVACSNCGRHMAPHNMVFVADRKNGNTFIEVVFGCSDCYEDTKRVTVIRYLQKDADVHVFGPCDEHKVSLENREAHSYNLLKVW